MWGFICDRHGQALNPIRVVISMRYNFLRPTTVRILAFAATFVSVGLAQDTIPPSPPINLTATAASCGQVNLSWNASTDTGGSGLKAYIISRSDGVSSTVGAPGITFSDTNSLRAATSVTYNVVAQDNAGN